MNLENVEYQKHPIRLHSAMIPLYRAQEIRISMFKHTYICDKTKHRKTSQIPWFKVNVFTEIYSCLNTHLNWNVYCTIHGRTKHKQPTSVLILLIVFK